MSTEPAEVLEGSIKPQVTEVPAVSEDAQAEDKSTHQYSTRSKNKRVDDKLTDQNSLKKVKTLVQPRLKPVPYNYSDLKKDAENGLVKQRSKTVEGIGEFCQTEDLPLNKRGFKYKPCRPNPSFSSTLYSTTDLLPYKVRPSYFDRSQGILFEDNMRFVTTAQGWRSVRSNVGVREGKYYLEFDIINANNSNDKSHVRIGFARREASLEAPVGFDGYGYGLRDLNGQKVFLSRPAAFMKNYKDVIEPGFKSGDTMGMLIELPSVKDHKQALEEFKKSRKEKFRSGHDISSRRKKKNNQKFADDEHERLNLFNNIVRDQIPIKYKSSLYFEQFEYTPTKKMEHLLNPVTVFGEKAILENNAHSIENKDIPIIPNSRITVFKNGVKIGVAFENLYSFFPLEYEDNELSTCANVRQQQNSQYHNTDDGTLGYYPMLSVFLEGVVGLNPGPDFKYPIEFENSDIQPLNNRYEEKVTDQWYWDLLDEVEAEYLDGFE